MTALEELAELTKSPYSQAVKDWKEKGGKVVGFTCAYVPEEILHAAGILAYRVNPTGCTETTEANVYMSSFNCTFSRACLQFALTGVYDFLDGVVMMNSCDHIRRMYENWKQAVGSAYLHFLSVPRSVGSGPEEWYKDEITIFKESVEKAFGVKITDESLRNSVKVYSKTRALLKKLYQLGERDNPPLKGSEMLKILIAGFQMPKEEYNQHLEKLLSEMEKKEGDSAHQARLMLMGGACDDPDFVKVIEDSGGLVGANTLCFGSRYFWDTIETTGDPMSALAKYYLNHPACARMADSQITRWDFSKQMLKRFKVDGVVYQRIRWCDLWGGETLYLGKQLKELDVPFLVLEREYWLSGAEQIKTRVQAFLEVIAGRV